MALLKFTIFALLVACVRCGSLANRTKEEELLQDNVKSSRKSRDIGPYLGLVTCAMKYDVSCFIDTAESFLAVQRTDLLAQADAEVARSSDTEARPSQLADTLSRLVSQLAGLFQNGLSGFWKAGREIDEEDDADDDEDVTEVTTTDSNGETRSRKKRRNKRLNSLLKLLAIGFIIYKKICLIAKLFSVALQYKFFMLAVAGLILHAIKFWLSLKKDAHPTKVIYYEHAQHQHHYGHGDEEIWARALTGGDTSPPYYLVT